VATFLKSKAILFGYQSFTALPLIPARFAASLASENDRIYSMFKKMGLSAHRNT